MPIWRDTVFTDHTPVSGGSYILQQYMEDASKVERPVLVAFPTVAQAVQDFVGFATLKVANGNRYISRTVPHAFEGSSDSTGLPWLWCQGVTRVEAMGPRGQRPRGDPLFQTARMVLLYTSRRYKLFEDHNPGMQGAATDDDTDPATGLATTPANPLAGLPDEATLLRYVTRQFKPTNRAVTIPQAILSWVPLDGSEPAAKILEGLGRKEPGVELVYTHHLRPDIPFGAIAGAMGCVNGAAFDGFAAGTLLCEEPDIELVVSPIGDTVYNVTFRFRYLPKLSRGTPPVARGHNWFLRAFKKAAATVLDYRRVNTDPAAPKPSGDVFQPFNFKKLFRPDQ